MLHQHTDGVKCRIFLTTLADSTQRWFNKLPSGSVRSFEDLSSTFLHHFATCKRYHKTPMNLFSMKQRSLESLREYIQRFNRVALKVPSVSSELLVSALSQGLVDGQFFSSLVKKPPINYDNLLRRAEKYINLEEAQRARKEDKTIRSTLNRHGKAPQHPPVGNSGESIGMSSGDLTTRQYRCWKRSPGTLRGQSEGLSQGQIKDGNQTSRLVSAPSTTRYMVIH